MRLFKYILRFLGGTLFFILAGIIGKQAFYQMNSVAADLCITAALFSMLFGFVIFSLRIK